MKKKIGINKELERMSAKAALKADHRERKQIILKYAKEAYSGYVYVEGQKAKRAYNAKTAEKLTEQMDNAHAAGLDRRAHEIETFDLAKHGLKKYDFHFENSGLAAQDTQYRFTDELMKFCTTDARCELALHMLSGSIVRRYGRFVGGPLEGVNVLQIGYTRDRSINAFLKAAADSFVCNRTGSNQYFKVVQVPYLPTDFRKPTVEASAYVTDTFSERLCMPAVYSDTAVVLNGYALKSRAEKLIRENWYCQTVLFGNVPKSLETWVVDRVSADQLGSLAVDWDVDCLKQMTSEFDVWITGVRARNAFTEARRVVDKNMPQGVSPNVFNWKRAELYMATVLLLTNFLRRKDDWDAIEDAEVCNLIFNAVLPGCYTPPAESGVPTQAIPLTEQNFEDAVQQVITCVLKDISKFVFIPRNDVRTRKSNSDKSRKVPWLTEEELEQNGLLGFLHMFDPKKKANLDNKQDEANSDNKENEANPDSKEKKKPTKDKWIPTVLFYQKGFVRLFTRYCPYRCTDEKLLDGLMSEFYKGVRTQYCPVRVRSRERIGEKYMDSVRLLVDKLDFLSEEKLEELKRAFQVKD